LPQDVLKCADGIGRGDGALDRDRDTRPLEAFINMPNMFCYHQMENASFSRTPKRKAGALEKTKVKLEAKKKNLKSFKQVSG